MAVGGSVNASDLGQVAHDMTLWGLFLQADWIVKLVMLGLIVASIWVWAVVFEKVTSLRRVNRAADAFEEKFWSGGSLEQLFQTEGERPTHPMAAVFGAAMREWERSTTRPNEIPHNAGMQTRAERAMGVAVQREMDGLERWMVFLASVGSVGPFVGLFGTVWGIMNSFSAIAGMNNTNLAVVAPGIAEALFATAIGLVAAIPAVLAYNKISTDLARFASRLESFSTEFAAILSRQAEERV
ncbi:protein TolQ [Roseomonas aerophila]|uniref:Tol-Pal system protein TolQ n=1 Tax=Teichococcus aerophilus TaxID=1224513 RepID=A0ABR7RVB6_9PROT|nr:protein TolQ [Pseudoroseomonas aerophila]MBC9209922.1 protein TolQ [Pseudoroseomonas aerophila]